MIGEIRHYVNDEVQSSNAATYRLELPNRGALHQIVLRAKCTNGATSGRGVTMLDVVDEIKLIGDGSEVIFDLYSVEFEKWVEAMTGEALAMEEDQSASAVQEIVLPIWFGRSAVDLEYWLPMARFNDLKLEVSFSPTIAADAGFATGTVTFDVLLVVTPEDGGLVYKGTLATRRIRSFTSAASGDEEVELPSNSIVRAVGVYAYEAAIEDGTDITTVELLDKSSGQSIVKADWLDLCNLNPCLTGKYITHAAKLLLGNNETWASRLGNIVAINVDVIETADATNDEYDAAFVDGVSGDTLTFDAYNVDITAGSESITAAAGDVALRVEAKGKAPSHFGFIPFVHKDDPDGWLDTSKMGKPTVTLSQGGADAAVYVAVQELKRY